MLAGRHFGVTASAEPLPSERDQNFLLTTADNRRFVLKIANATEQPEILEFQNAALEHLASRRPGLAVPRLAALGVRPIDRQGDGRRRP